MFNFYLLKVKNTFFINFFLNFYRQNNYTLISYLLKLINFNFQIQLAPFVLNSLQRKTYENEKIRRGIPNKFEIVHSTQGIPDPWKVIFSENDFYPEQNEAEEEICLVN